MKSLHKLALILVLTIFAGCSGSQSGTTSATPKLLTGKAALGAYFADGSLVELRGAAFVPSPSPTPSPDPSASASPSASPSPIPAQPSIVLKTTVQGGAGEYTIDVSTLDAPYLIRVQDAASGTWYYSYTDGTQLVANANPYTDLLVRSWYENAYEIGGNPGNLNIDTVFDTGVYPSGTANITSLNPPASSGTLPDGTPFTLPNPATMALAGTTLSNTVSRAYLMDLENVLTASWVPGVGFDSLLDSIGISNLSPVINASLTASYYAPNYLESALLYLEVVMAQSGASSGAQSVQLTADIYSQASTMEVKDARSGHGQTVSFTETSSGSDNHFTGALTLTGLPALYYQLTVDGDAYSTVQLYASYYGTMTFAGDGSVSGFVPGTGAVVNSATGGSVQYSISDLTPIDVQITASGSSTVLFEKTYTRGASWSGSDTLGYDIAGAAFDLHIVGANGERTVVQYTP